MTLHVRNTDSLRRPAHITVRFVPKIREPVDSILSVPPEYRQQVWMDRPIRKVRLAGDDVADVAIQWKTAQPSVYDVGGANLSVEAVFEGQAEVHKFSVSIFFLIRI